MAADTSNLHVQRAALLSFPCQKTLPVKDLGVISHYLEGFSMTTYHLLTKMTPKRTAKIARSGIKRLLEIGYAEIGVYANIVDATEAKLAWQLSCRDVDKATRSWERKRNRLNAKTAAPAFMGYLKKLREDHMKQKPVYPTMVSK